MSLFFPQLRSRFLGIFISLSLLGVCLAGTSEHNANAQSTNIQVTSTVQQSDVHRLGVNLGDQTYWDSGQMLKNLIFQNPGFEGQSYRTILYCANASATSCQDNNQGSPQPANFWQNGTYFVLTGNAAGTTGTIKSSAAANNSVVGAGISVVFDKSLNIASGDYVSVSNYFPGSGDTGWWDATSGGGTITTETNDLSPETPGKQAIVLNANASGQQSTVTQYFDDWTGLSFVQLNGTFAVTFRAKGVGGNNKLNVLAQRIGYSPWINQALTLTNNWQDYTLNFSATEIGSAIGTVQLVFNAAGAKVELDDVAWTQTNSNPSNPTAFRDDVVNALNELHPGTIRMMESSAGLGSSVIDQIQVPFARSRGGFNIFGTNNDYIPYGIHEFLQLCQTVGADPYMTIPTATTPQEMTEFVEYLSGNGSDPYSALRISRGQTAPWTSVFNKIHIELGNETWNGGFKGESMLEPFYARWANSVFGAARTTNGFEADKFDLVLSGFAGSPGYNQGNLLTSTQHDSIDIAPYLLSSAKNEAQNTMFGALFAEPEMFESPGGEVYQNMLYAAAATKPTNVNVYETNLSTTGGSITEAEVNSLTPSLGAGLAHTDHMLQMMRLGVKYQNAFSLPEYAVNGGPGLVRLWGIVVDMGTTNRKRPQFLTQALANSVIGGSMLQTVQTGANPTWNQPLSSDNVQFNGAHYLQSFAFVNGNTISTIVFNLNLTNGLPVTFSGPNAPTGTVQLTQITSANITDNNETGNVVQPVTKTIAGFNASAGLTLPPYSMTVISWSSNTTQAPQFSVPAGTYTAAQSVGISDTTPGATIHYTTNGSTPSASSPVYGGPITVGSNETLQAIAFASGLAVSPISSAKYTIQSITTAPVFSVVSGTYGTAQTVTLSDATPGAVVYYTTNGSTPTTSSTQYMGPINVSSSETINAIAVAPGASPSGVASATYQITVTSTPVLNFPNGFTAGQLHLNGSASLKGTILQLTNGGLFEAGSGFFTKPVSIEKFTSDFDFQLPSSTADGFTFTIQNASTGTASLGAVGDGLGYRGVGNSFAVAFDFFQANSNNAELVGLFTGGTTPAANLVDISPSGLNLHSGDPFHAHLSYSNGVLSVTLTDKKTGASEGGPVNVDLPGIIGSGTAYVGFTGGTGAYSSIQDIVNWTFEN